MAFVLIAASGWLAARRDGPVVDGALAGLAFGSAAWCARATHPTFVGVLGTVSSGALPPSALWEWSSTPTPTPSRPATSGRSPALRVTEVVVPVIAGAVVLGDRVRHGWAIPALGGT